MYWKRGCIYKFFFLFFLSQSVCAGPVFAQTFYPFEGEVDFKGRTLQAKIDMGRQGLISLSVAQESPTKLEFSLNLDQFQLPFLSFSTLLKGDVALQNDAKGDVVYTGKIKSEYTLLNDKPTEELTGRFVIRNNTLFLEGVRVGTVSCNGKIALGNGFKSDLKFTLHEVGLQEFIAFWYGGKIIPSSGLVNGMIEAKGGLDHLDLKGQLTSSSGHVGKLEFDNMLYHAQGIYPIITLFDSNITETSGRIFAIKGMLDLSDTKNFKKQIIALNKMPIVSESDFKSEWTLKRLRDEEHSSSTELKYMRKKPSALDFVNEDEDAMLGIERKIQF